MTQNTSRLVVPIYQSAGRGIAGKKTDRRPEGADPAGRPAAQRSRRHSDIRQGLRMRLYKSATRDDEEGGTDKPGKRCLPLSRLQKGAAMSWHKNHRSYGDATGPGMLQFLDDLPLPKTEHAGSCAKLENVAILASDSPPQKALGLPNTHASEQAADDQIVPDDLTGASHIYDENPNSPDEETTEDDDDITMSVASSSERVERTSMRRLLPTAAWPGPGPLYSAQQAAPGNGAYPSQANMYYSGVLSGALVRPPSASAIAIQGAPLGAGWSEVSESWQHLQDQRIDVKKHRRDLANLKSVLRLKQKEKAEADRELHMLALSYSKSEKQLPRQKVVELYSKAEKLKDACDTMESQCDEIGAKLDRKTARLEAHENGFYKRMASEAVDSHVSAAMARHPQGANTHGTARQHATQDTMTAPPEERKRHPSQRSTGEDKETTQQHSIRDATLLGISGERPRDEHPVYGHLLQAIGDLRIAKEGHDELRLERDEIIDSLQTRIALERNRKGEDYNLAELQAALRGDYSSDAFRASFASYLGAGDLEFLQGWHEKRKHAKADIAAKEMLVGQMRDWCRSVGALPAYMPFEEQEAVLGAVLDKERQAKAISVEIDAAVGHTFSTRGRHALLAHPTFPKLLSNPYHLLESPPVVAREAVARALRLPDGHPAKKQAKEDSIKEYGIESTLMRYAQGNKADFINRWLLQQLRTSSLEVLRLFMVMSETLNVMNLLRWQDDVVYYWPLDDANKRTNFVYHAMTDSEDSLPGRASLPSESSW